MHLSSNGTSSAKVHLHIHSSLKAAYNNCKRYAKNYTPRAKDWDRVTALKRYTQTRLNRKKKKNTISC